MYPVSPSKKRRRETNGTESTDQSKRIRSLEDQRTIDRLVRIAQEVYHESEIDRLIRIAGEDYDESDLVDSETLTIEICRGVLEHLASDQVNNHVLFWILSTMPVQLAESKQLCDDLWRLIDQKGLTQLNLLSTFLSRDVFEEKDTAEYKAAWKSAFANVFRDHVLFKLKVHQYASPGIDSVVQLFLEDKIRVTTKLARVMVDLISKDERGALQEKIEKIRAPFRECDEWVRSLPSDDKEIIYLWSRLDTQFVNGPPPTKFPTRSVTRAWEDKRLLYVRGRQRLKQLFLSAPRFAEDTYLWRGWNVQSRSGIARKSAFFMATTTEFKVAKSFSGSSCCMSLIWVPAGTPFLSVSSISRFPQEREILLPCDFSLRPRPLGGLGTNFEVFDYVASPVFTNESLSSIFSKLLTIAGRVVQTKRETDLMQRFGKPRTDWPDVLLQQLESKYRNVVEGEVYRMEEVVNTDRKGATPRQSADSIVLKILPTVQYSYVTQFGWSNDDSLELRAAGVKMMLDIVLMMFARPSLDSSPDFDFAAAHESIALMLWPNRSDRRKFSDSEGDEHTELIDKLLRRLRIKDSEVANISGVLMSDKNV